MPAKKKLSKLPAWFNQYHRPYVGPEPVKDLEIKVDVNKVQIFDGDEIPNDGKNYYIDVSRGYDDDADELYLVEFTKEIKANPYYQAQVRSRKEQLERAAEWDVLIKDVEAIRAASLEADERALLKKLQKKYPSK